MKIRELIGTLRDLGGARGDGRVFLFEDGTEGQWPATLLRPATPGENQRAGSKTGVRMAVITTGEGEELTLQSLVKQLKRGWPENGNVCAGVFEEDDGIKVGDIRAPEWRFLKQFSGSPSEERVVAIAIRYFASG